MKKITLIFFSICYLTIFHNSISAASGCAFSNSNNKVVYCNNLKDFESIKNKNNIESLTINSAKVVAIPNSITNLPNLKRLNLANNMIKSIPKNIKSLSKLEVLILNNNGINSLNNIDLLPTLKELYLSGNDLNVVSSKINKLTKLRILDLENNQITYLSSLNSNVQLRKLNLKDNMLITLPSLSQVNLDDLNVENNYLTTNTIASKNNVFSISNQNTIVINENSFNLNQVWYNQSNMVRNAIKSSNGDAIVGFEKYTITNIKDKNNNSYNYNILFENDNSILKSGEYYANILLSSGNNNYILNKTIKINMIAKKIENDVNEDDKKVIDNIDQVNRNQNDIVVDVDLDKKVNDLDKKDSLLKTTLENNIGQKFTFFMFNNIYWLRLTLFMLIIAMLITVVLLLRKTLKTEKSVENIIS
ncbi:hypothetical protein OKW22_000293 [Bacilli bacterium PM5-3]|nr:hypothetical protein [Bacilli bacterium PM5-3]